MCINVFPIVIRLRNNRRKRATEKIFFEFFIFKKWKPASLINLWLRFSCVRNFAFGIMKKIMRFWRAFSIVGGSLLKLFKIFIAVFFVKTALVLYKTNRLGLFYKHKIEKSRYFFNFSVIFTKFSEKSGGERKLS